MRREGGNRHRLMTAAIATRLLSGSDVRQFLGSGPKGVDDPILIVVFDRGLSGLRDRVRMSDMRFGDLFASRSSTQSRVDFR